MSSIDLNCDMGEMPEALADGNQEALMRYVSSANVACGGHAGDRESMRATIEQCLRHGVAIGAHPGYEDRVNFGRTELHLPPEEVAASVCRQVAALDQIAITFGAHIRHVKPHGALYNQAARDASIARAIAEGVRLWRPDVILVGLAGSVMLQEFQAAGFAVAAEGFADRRYEQDGALRSRKFPDALLTNPEDAAAQALQLVQQGSVMVSDGVSIPLLAQTICIHGDTPGAVDIVAHVRSRLEQAGVTIAQL
jgi:5-oxoprolinase (ATP-hydrolysing) subunit A